MRLLTALSLAGTLVLAGCGDEEPEPGERPSPERPAPSPPAVDTALGDTVADAGGPDDTATVARDSTTAAARIGGAAGAGGAGAVPDRSPTEGSRLYTVQVGAFLEAGKARSLEDQLTRQGFPTWVSTTELRGRTFHRLRVGAVGTVAQARRLGRLITARYAWPVWVAPLTEADAVPEGTVERTRLLLDAD